MVRQSRWIVIVMIVLMAISPALAQQAYTDPAGRFTVTVPAGWQDKSTANYGLFTNNSGISTYLLAVQGSDAQAGVDAALKIVAPNVTGKASATNPVPLPNGTWTQDVYIQANQSLVVAEAQAKDNLVYVVVFTIPNAAALQSNQVDLNSFLLGFTIGKPIDLSQQKPAVLSADQLKQIGDYISAMMQKYQVVGASVAIVENGKAIYDNGFGALEQDGKTPVNGQTLFMIGSVTKSMTTMMTGTLVDDGKLTWDEPATQILPDFKLSDSAATAKIRVRDLFNMSSGIPRYDIPLELQTYTSTQVQQEIATIPLASQPGQTFHYSNFMVALGGYAAAVADGSSLDQAENAYSNLMQERVFDPIGMSSTTLDFNKAIANPNHALPYALNPFQDQFQALPIKGERFVTSIMPAGAVWSNADDMGKYLITELAQGVAPDGKRVISQQNLLETWKPEIAMGGGQSYGMGWQNGSYHGQELIQHDGNTSGFSANVAFLPDANIGVVVLSNKQLANEFIGAVHDYIFETAFGLEHTADAYYSGEQQLIDGAIQQIVQQTHYTTNAIDPKAVADYTGKYERGVDVHFDAAGQLVVSGVYGDIPLLATSQPNYFISSGIQFGAGITFQKDAQGAVSMKIDSLLGPLEGEQPPLTIKKIS